MNTLTLKIASWALFIGLFISPNLNGQTKLDVNGSMVTLISGAGDPSALFDEQTIAGDPATGNDEIPSSKWVPGLNASDYPSVAVIDLEEVVKLTQIYLFGMNSAADFIVEADNNGTWITLFTDQLSLYQKWVEHNVSISTRYLRFTLSSQATVVGEVVLYGTTTQITNEAPILASIGNQNLVAGTELDLTINASDPDNDPITFSATGLPGFIALTDNGNGTALLKFTPQSSDTRTYGNINITVNDGNGESDSETFFAIVNATSQEQKLVLTQSMVTDESGTNAYKLVDEQTVAGDPLNSPAGYANNAWVPDWNASSYPASATINLGQTVPVSKIFLRDVNASGNFNVYSGTPGNWNLLFTDGLTGYMTWNQHDVSVTTQYLRFEMESKDSNMSEVVIYGGGATIVDETAPASITNLTAGNATLNSLTLNWIAPGDDINNGVAKSYDLRMSTSPIDEGNFSSSTVFNGIPSPVNAGTNQSTTVSSLTSETSYYFAIKTSDEVGNTSIISNVASATTASACTNCGSLTLRIKFNQTPSVYEVQKAALKFNKQFAYSFTLDDGLASHYSNAFQILNGGTIDDGTTVPGYTYTDGCGNSIPFTAGIAVNASEMQDDIAGYHISWNQLQEMFNTGWDLFNHSYTHAAYANVVDYNDEVTLNTTAVSNKIGFDMTHFAVPSGDTAYYQAAFDNGMIALYQNRWGLIGTDDLPVDTALDFFEFKMRRHYIDGSGPFNADIDHIASVSDSINHYWYNDFTHGVENTTPSGGISVTDFITYMAHIESNYGESGSNQIWMAPIQEVYEYLNVRDNIQYSIVLEGNDLIVNFDLSTIPQNFRRKAISLNINSDSDFSSIEVSGASNYSFNGIGSNKLINLEWDIDQESTNTAPVIGAISNEIIIEGATKIIKISANDAENDTLTFSASNLPSFATFTDNGNRTATVNCSPAIENIGIYNNIEVQVSDGKLTYSKIFTIEIKAPETILYPTIAAGDTGLVINPSNELHETSSYIISTVRNHIVSNQMDKDLKEIVEKYGSIKPVFGEKKKLYRLGHGPTDGRSDYSYMYGYHYEDWFGITGTYPYDDIRWGLQESKMMDSDVIMVINYGTGTPEEAGRLTSYLNKSTDSLRNAHGDNLWNVELFEIGNEICWDIVLGYSQYSYSPSVYAQRAKLYAQQMRANSDIPIEIGIVASVNSNWMGTGWPNTATGNRLQNIEIMMDTLKNEVDFFIYHGYSNSWPLTEGGLLGRLAMSQWTRDNLLNRVIPTINEGIIRNDITHPVGIANTEYFGRSDYSSGMNNMTYEALYTADNMITALVIKELKLASNFCFSHGDLSDNLFFYSKDSTRTTNVFDVHKMVAESLGDMVIESNGQFLPETPAPDADLGRPLENLSWVATKRADGAVVLFIINRTEQDATIPIDPGFAVSNVTMNSLVGETYSNNNMTVTQSSLSNLNNVNIRAASINIIIFE